MENKQTIKVIIAEDHPIFLEGLKTVLSNNPNRNYDVVATASNGDDLLEIMRLNETNIVLLDMNMPGKDGLEILEYMAKRKWRLPILAVTMYDDPKIIRTAFKTGIDGYILKQNTVEELYKGIEEVLAGNTYMGRGVSLHAIGKSEKTTAGQKFEDRFIKKNNLTRRELEVLRHIAQAMSNKEIAEKLFISDQTVSVHRKNIMRKLGVSNTAGLIKTAYDNQLI
ncbi:MAG: DNA-binding NarL/FixJ family response regulator [Saprospiraceae bacterium]|jgi:DNA-binding NarL/FixJ family response regulator